MRIGIVNDSALAVAALRRALALDSALEIVWVAVDPASRQPVNVPQAVRDWLKSFLD